MLRQDGEPLSRHGRLMSQPPITDFFPRIEHGGNTVTLYLTLTGQEYRIGELDLYEDDNGRYWVNNVEVNDQWQRRGYGRLLIREAADHYGATIYFSKQTNQEARDNDDTRHLSTEGAALANSCVSHGLNAELRHPREFEEPSDDDGNESD